MSIQTIKQNLPFNGICVSLNPLVIEVGTSKFTVEIVPVNNKQTENIELGDRVYVTPSKILDEDLRKVQALYITPY